MVRRQKKKKKERINAGMNKDRNNRLNVEWSDIQTERWQIISCANHMHIQIMYT